MKTTYRLQQGRDTIEIQAFSQHEAKLVAAEYTGKDRWTVIPKATCTIKGDHCSQCGSIDGEDLNTRDGYTLCCNEPVTGWNGICSAYGDHN